MTVDGSGVKGGRTVRVTGMQVEQVFTTGGWGVAKVEERSEVVVAVRKQEGARVGRTQT